MSAVDTAATVALPFLAATWVVWVVTDLRKRSARAGSDHGACADLLRRMVAEHPCGLDVHVSAEPPIVHSRWTQKLTCPHGVRFWAEPTGEQLAAWGRETR